MRAAAEHLTPVTLELGGKSPVFVDKNLDLPAAARRIIQGKTMNSGQTCIAPDYALIHSSIFDKFVAELKKVTQSFFGDNPKNSSDYGRMINERQTKRVGALLEGQEILFGGEVDPAAKYIAPTLVKCSLDSTAKIMQDEIFGPVLPLISIPDIDTGIEFVNSRPKPLTLYIFSNDTAVQQRILDNTTSGGAAINDCMFQMLSDELPFGGVGPSGMGAYHGKHTFLTFSHQRGILNKTTLLDMNVRYPPFNPSKISMMKHLL